MVNPRDVAYRGWELTEVVHETEAWSLVRGNYRGDDAVALRWNGGGPSDNGFPVSRGQPVWFILPGELAEQVCAIARRLEL